MEKEKNNPECGIRPGLPTGARLVHAGPQGPISVSFCVSDSFVQHLAVVLASLAANNPDDPFVFHVLHRDITPAHQRLLTDWHGGRDDITVVFHPVDAALFADFPIPPELEHVTQEMYYRFLLPTLLPDETRTIYSDVDVCCVGNIRPLWETDLGDNVLAAVSEGAAGEFKKKLIGLEGPAPYFYSGLLVMDLAQMRREDAVSRLFATTAAYAQRIAWPDQDVLNIVFRNRILPLGPAWDGINVRYSPYNKEVRIWHFPGALMKPWCNIWKNRTWPLYLKYLRRTPFRDRAAAFVWGHIKGFFWFTYTKKRVRRTLCCGVLVHKKKMKG